jgi:mono/diheme cytochrome c family protein
MLFGRNAVVVGVAALVSFSCSSATKSLGEIFAGRSSKSGQEEVSPEAGGGRVSGPNQVLNRQQSTADSTVPASGYELAALAVFERSCFACHGKDGANAGNMGSILNIANLVDRNLIKFGSADESKLLQRMNDTQQPMPPAGLLPQSDRDIVKQWILGTPNSDRVPLEYPELYTLIESDWLQQNDKVNIRYFHLANLYNSGAPESVLESTRGALSKTLNMLSTTETITLPTAIDERKLIFRVNLRDFDIHRPETLYTYMLKRILPTLSKEMRDKWLPAPEDRVVANFYGARYKEMIEGKGTTSGFVKPGIHTFAEGLPVADHPALKKMAQAMREAAQKVDAANPDAYGEVSLAEAADTKRCQTEQNPQGITCSFPAPLLRADWFVSQVAANMRMRLYYHGAGMDDDTVTLDVALAIDDVEGFIVDNDPGFDASKWTREPLIRSAFNNSGVSINHRAIERVPADYTPGRPLWRSYEFKDKTTAKHRDADVFEFPNGPFFEISADGNPGHECITVLTPMFTEIPRIGSPGSDRVRTMRLLDLNLLYPSKMPDDSEPRVVAALKRIRPTETSSVSPANTAEYVKLLGEFRDLYQHEDYFAFRSDAYVAKYGGLPIIQAEELGQRRMLRCEINPDYPAFRHESLEYLFLKRNGLQAFVNVGLSAEHLDYKIPNQRALENKEALLIPAHDNPSQMVVGAPISCLSCHAKGYIEKEDMVSKYVKQSSFLDEIKAKVQSLYAPFDVFKAQMTKDNQVFRTALAKTGVSLEQPEPIVATYRNWAIQGLSLAQVAAELEVSQSRLSDAMKTDAKVSYLLRELKIDGSLMKRSEFELAYYELMCVLHKSCKKVAREIIIPAQ